MSKRSAVLGYVVLIILLSAGTAQGLAGKDTVTGGDVVNGSLSGADIKDDSLTGSDVNESTLALSTGVTSSRTEAQNGERADPFANPDVHVEMSVTVAKPGRLVFVAALSSYKVTCGASACNDVRLGLYIDGVPVPRSAINLDNIGANGSKTLTNPAFFGVTSVTAGEHTVLLGAKGNAAPLSSASPLNLRIMAFS